MRKCLFSEQLFVAVVRFAAVLLRPIKHRGLGVFGAKFARILRLCDRAIIVKGGAGDGLVVWAGDSYWMRLFDRKFVYEPEIESLLGRIAPLVNLYLDCGANIGYWIRHASKVLRPDANIVALEPGGDTFSLLEKNTENIPNCICLNAAIVPDEGVDQVGFWMANGAHASRRIASESDHADTVMQVAAIPIQSILAAPRRLDGVALIKLDVEGLEAKLLARLRANLVAGECVVVFEEHGKDRASEASRVVLECKELVLVWLHQMHRIETISQVECLKLDPRVGYNCLVCNADLYRALQIV